MTGLGEALLCPFSPIFLSSFLRLFSDIATLSEARRMRDRFEVCGEAKGWLEHIAPFSNIICWPPSTHMWPDNRPFGSRMCFNSRIQLSRRLYETLEALPWLTISLHHEVGAWKCPSICRPILSSIRLEQVCGTARSCARAAQDVNLPSPYFEFLVLKPRLDLIASLFPLSFSRVIMSVICFLLYCLWECLAEAACVDTPPVAIPITDVELSNGHTMRGAQLSVGSPAQNISCLLHE